MERRWYLLQCKPRECQRAREHLERQGYEAFLPVLTREALRRGQPVAISEPLFPHYLFVRLSDVADNWAPIRSTRGAVGLVRFGAMPLAVPEPVVLVLQQRQAEAFRTQTVEALFQPGDAVEIVAGPLAGLEAVLAAREGSERVVLLIRLLQQARTVTLPVTQIRHAP